MKILHISSARTVGGGERHLADLLNALSRRGHEVYAALRPRSPLRAELGGVPPQNIFTLRLRNALDLGSAVELGRVVREYKIEIVHAHVGRDYPLAAMALRRNREAKLIITRHVLFRLNKLHAVTFRHVSRVIAVSGAVARVLAAQKIFPADKIKVIPNGIDFRRLDAGLRGHSADWFRRRIEIPSSALVVGTAGELKKQKGQEDFLRAAELVARRKPNVHFVIAGRDTSRTGEYRARLERLVKELDLTERVHLAGWLENVAPLLATLDVYVSASHTESFGLSMAEAMAFGLPVVATATEGAREIIDNEDLGTLVPIGETETLAEATLRLLENEDERRRVGELARVYARERFSLERMVDATEKVYSEVMNEE